MLVEAFRTLALSPSMAWHRLLYPVLLRAGWVGLERMLFSSRKQNVAEFVGQYSDQWIGPVFRQVTAIPENATRLEYTLQHIPQADGHHGTIHPQLLVNGRVQDRATIGPPQQFVLKADVSAWRGKECCVEIHIPEFFIPGMLHTSNDTRRLSAIMINTAFHRTGSTAPAVG